MKITQNQIADFQKTVWGYYATNRRNFPWRKTKIAYRILVSEIMLQQTQADRVVRFYEAFLKKFPTLEALAKAPFSEIYPLWQGLGYNRRGMMLKKSAEKAMADFKGKLPKDYATLETFPGIGPYTARAVSIFAHNTPVACIETNIRRAYIYHFLHHKRVVQEKDIMRLAELCLPAQRSREWHWALMDYGAYIKTIAQNPNRKHKNYATQSTFEGSIRQIRGEILRLLATQSMDGKSIAKKTKRNPAKLEQALASLKTEGLINQSKKTGAFSLA